MSKFFRDAGSSESESESESVDEPIVRAPAAKP